MKYPALLFFFIIAQLSYTQITPSLSPLIETMTNIEFDLNPYNNGIHRPINPTYLKFEMLTSIATDDELIALTDHKMPHLRCYAFLGLVEKKHPKTFRILQKHLNDNEETRTVRGCLGEMKSVGQVYLELVSTNYSTFESYRFSEVQRRQLSDQNLFRDSSSFTQDSAAIQLAMDNMILYDTTNKKPFAIQVLHKIAPDPANYIYIKRLYQTGFSAALNTIARYKKEEDVPFFLNLLENEMNPRKRSTIYYAIGYFTHPDFFPYLENAQDQDIQLTQNGEQPADFGSSVYHTILKYRNNNSKALIRKVLFHEDEYTAWKHGQVISRILKYNNDPYYDVFAERLQELAEIRW